MSSISHTTNAEWLVVHHPDGEMFGVCSPAGGSDDLVESAGSNGRSKRNGYVGERLGAKDDR